MAVNYSALSVATTTALSLSNLVLVTPAKKNYYKPTQQNNKSINDASILFHIEGENIGMLQSDITDYFVEDNTSIEDNIALRPEEYTVRGFIGELNNIVPEELEAIKLVADKLLIMGAYTPELTTAGLEAYNNALLAYQLAQNIASSAVSKWDSVNKSSSINEINGSGLRDQIPNANQTQQAIYFQKFYGYWRNKTLFDVQTPWAIFKNMAIKNIRAIQEENTNMITDFEITFKMMRFAPTQKVAGLYSSSDMSGRASNQGESLVNLGITKPAETTSLQSILGG